MNDFFSDLLQDLRQKRLLPVAILLAIGIVAIPVAMAKSPAEPPAPEPAAAVAEVPERDALTLEVNDAESSAKGSSLNVLSKRNPFRPPSSVTAPPKSTATAAGASDQVGAGGGTKPSDPGGSGGTGDGGAQTPTAPNPVPVKTVEYEYVADVTFWNGERRRERRMRKLDMLPNQSMPLLIFMGATKGGGDAVFLVDSSLDTTGEGSCRPSGANCTFVHLGPGSEHLFTTEAGDSYRLRVDEIRRVKLRAASSSDRRAAVNGAAVRSRPFNLPRLVDTVEETGSVNTPSSPAADGR